MKLTVDVYESVTGRIKLGKIGSDCGVKGYRITMKHLGTTELDITETQAPSAIRSGGTKLTKEEVIEKSHPIAPSATCSCYNCNPMLHGRKMFLCQECGNKRCPKATDHRNKCTNSNEPDQSGSIYSDSPTPSAKNVIVIGDDTAKNTLQKVVEQLSEIGIAPKTAPSATVENTIEYNPVLWTAFNSGVINQFQLDELDSRFRTVSRSAPSATVDEPKGLHSCPDAKVWADYYCAINPDADNGLMIGWFANAMMAMHDHLYQTNKLHSQQPTVDVAKEIADDVQQTLECSDKYRNVIEKRISEALRGTCTREDLANFANMISMSEDGSKYEGNTMNRLLSQYDTKRNTK